MESQSPMICGYPIRSGPSSLFRLAVRLNRWKLRGGYRLAAFASRGRVVDYDLGDGFHLAVPLYREDNRVSQEDVRHYEYELREAICEAASSMTDATLIDCGADIGMMSVLLRRQISAIGYIVAFEPNAEVLPFLNRNLAMLPCSSLILGHAVGNQNGAGRLVRPAADPSDHARFVEPNPRGNVRLITIDSLALRGDVILKIDVEGGEMAVLEGALDTIRQAPCCVISMEVHPRVIQRTGRDPAAPLRLLDSVRGFRYIVTGVRTRYELNSVEEPMVAEDDPTRVLNVLAVSRQ